MKILVDDLGRTPTVREVAERAGLSQSDVNLAMFFLSLPNNLLPPHFTTEVESQLIDEILRHEPNLYPGPAKSEEAPGLTKPLEPRDAQQVREGAKSVEEIIKVFDALASKIETVQKATAGELEPHLHRLPAIQFNSLEEKQRFEESLASLLSRLDKRLVRFDPEHNAPVSEPPSRLRCDSVGDGYFRLEYFRDGKKHREELGPTLPPLSLASPPSDARRRPK